MASIAVPRGAVLADFTPRAGVLRTTLARDAALVVGGAALTGLAAQVAIPLPGTPVPMTLQTFAALTVGAALGWRRGGLAMLAYLVAGALGVPWFSAGSSGLFGASAGYVVGMVLAAALVGAAARRGGDRTVPATVATMLAGTVVIYAVGVPWLMAVTGMGFGAALLAGVVPFLIGDAVKVAAAAGVLPAAWRFVRHARG